MAKSLLLTAALVAAAPRTSRRNEVKRQHPLWAQMANGTHLLAPSRRIELARQGRLSRAYASMLQPSTDPVDLAAAAPADPPATFSWASQAGVNYLTPIRNQHIPVYCGSCWAFAATSSLSDRWNVANGLGANHSGMLPHVMLSTQNCLSCGNDKVSCGTCNGGDDAAVYQYAKLYGIPHESCSNYMAQDTTCLDASPVDDTNKPNCYTCWPNNTCTSLKRHDRLYISEFGLTSGYDHMKAEIHARGPISCGIAATDKMEVYEGGIYSEEADFMIDHVISVVGWGLDASTGDEYWHVRNSWGHAWGEGGMMRIVTSRNTGPAGTGNNLVEAMCAFGVVDRFAAR